MEWRLVKGKVFSLSPSLSSSFLSLSLSHPRLDRQLQSACKVAVSLPSAPCLAGQLVAVVTQFCSFKCVVLQYST